MNGPKYELTCEKKQIGKSLFKSVTVYRIRALRDFRDVKRGDKGGWVEGPHNLAQEGDCWIYDDAAAYDSARIIDNAQLREKATAYGSAILRGDSVVRERARIFEHAVIGDHMILAGAARAYGDALIE